MKAFKIVGLAAALALTACGKVGPYTVEIQAKQNFEVIGKNDTAVVFAPEQNRKGLATYAPFSKKLELEIGSEKIIFKKTRIDKASGELLSIPSESGVRTTSGEYLGLNSRRSLVCNPECERVERDIRTEPCTYFIMVPETRCYADSDGYVGCRTVYVRRPRYGYQTVERITRTRDYDVNGVIFGATLGEMARTHSSLTEVDVETRILSACQ